MSLIRTTILGDAIRAVTGRRLLKYPDEEKTPERYSNTSSNEKKASRPFAEHKIERKPSPVLLAPPIDGADPARTVQQPPRRPSVDASRGSEGAVSDAASERTRVEREASRQGDKDGEKNKNLVEFEENDPENPKNWSTGYKCFVTAQIAFLTFSVYSGSSCYTSALTGPNSIMTTFDVSQESAIVGLTVFVAGYGVGPLLWSPMSEIPAIGRNPVYIGTLLVFVLLQIPTALAPNIHVLLAMRFLAGFFGSPALATGGASLADMFSPKKLAYPLAVWGCGAVSGPVLGPLYGGFTYQALGWQWPIWTLMMLSGTSLIVLSIFLPETSSAAILHKRAKRLRRETGNEELKSQADIDSSKMSAGAMVKMSLLQPIILLFEPIVFCLNMYISLVYLLLYAWLESFPLVFIEGHGFNPGENGLAFLGILVGSLIGVVGYLWYAKRSIEPAFEKSEDGTIKPEQRLPPLFIAAFFIPISLFMFSWTGAYPSIHWIAPIIGSSFFGIGSFCLFQAIFGYLTDAYPKDAAAVLAGNDLMRSGFGAAIPLVAGPLFSKLGIAGGGSLLGGLAVLFIPIPFVFHRYGSKIRSKSKRAVQDDKSDDDSA